MRLKINSNGQYINDHQMQDIFVEDDQALSNFSGNLARSDSSFNLESDKSQDQDDSGHANLKPEKLQYIFEMLTELQKLSRSINEPMISYLIEMAILETNTALNPDGESLRTFSSNNSGL